MLVSYLDDIYIKSANPNGKGAIVQFFEGGSDDGFHLNPTKTTVTSLKGVSTNPTGLPVLGSLIGGLEARRSFFKGKVDGLRPALQRLRDLPRQQGFLLLRMCYAPQLRHLLRSMDLRDMDPELRELDCVLFDTMDFLRGAPADMQRTEVVERIYSLPITMGGCGILSYKETSQVAYAASTSMALAMLAERRIPHVNAIGLHQGTAGPLDGGEAVEIPEEGPSQREGCSRVYDMGLSTMLQTLTDAQAVAFLDQGSKGGTAWMHARPGTTGHRALTDRQVAAALNIRTLQPDIYCRTICDRCGVANSPLHFEVCGAVQLPGQTRHNYVRDLLAKGLRQQQRTVELEPLLNNQTLHRADIRVGSAEGIPAMDPSYGLLDLTIKAPLAGDTAGAREAARTAADVLAAPAPAAAAAAAATEEEEEEEEVEISEARRLSKKGWAQVEAALEVAAQAKRTHYAQLESVQPVFPLVISSGGTLHREAYKCLRELIPLAAERRTLLVDISIALVRARTNIYPLS